MNQAAALLLVGCIAAVCAHAPVAVVHHPHEVVHQPTTGE